VGFELRRLFRFPLRPIKSITFASLMLVFPAFILSSCINAYFFNGLPLKQDNKGILSITSDDPVFDLLEKKWVSSFYFDRGMKYKRTRLKVVSLSNLLKRYNLDINLDAILLRCADDYEGIISINDVKHYDIQVALKVELAEEDIRPDWLKPLLIVVPNHSKPPFSERFFTANINELRFVRLADYYAPLEIFGLKNISAKFGLDIFKNNCLFCHSINKVGGNKGSSLVSAFNLNLDREKQRFRDRFIEKHGASNSSQNMSQFLVKGQFDSLLAFLREVSINNT